MINRRHVCFVPLPSKLAIEKEELEKSQKIFPMPWLTTEEQKKKHAPVVLVNTGHSVTDLNSLKNADLSPIR